MSGPPKVPAKHVYSAEEVRELANVGYQHGTQMSFPEMGDLISFFKKFTTENRSFEESFSLFNLKNVPKVCLSFAAPLPLISLFQQCFYSGVYDTGLPQADKSSHTLSLECQRLLGELLLDEEESKISVTDLTHRLLNRLSPKNSAWIGAMSNFFAACKGLLGREHLSILRKETAGEIEIEKPFTLPQVFVFVANKAKLNLLTQQLARRQLLDCFDQWNCSLKDCLALFQQDLDLSLQTRSAELQQTIKQAYFSWSAKLERAFGQLVRRLAQPLDREWIEFFDQIYPIIDTLDAEEQACALFVKNNWQRFEHLEKKFVKRELELLADLASVLEPLTLVRYLNEYLKNNPNLDQKLNAEQLRFDLMQAYSKQCGYPEPNSCWKRALSFQVNLKGKSNAREFLKASMCCSQLHKLLCDMRPILKAATAITSQELQSLFAKRERLVDEIEKALSLDKVIEELLASSKSKLPAAVTLTVEDVTPAAREEVEEEQPLPEAVVEKSYPEALLLVTEDLQQAFKSISWTVPATKRQFLQNGAMKLSLLTAELLSASQGLRENHQRFHAMTVAKYIHGMLQELLTAILENPAADRVHSLTALAQLAKVDRFAELFTRYDNAGAEARRPLHNLEKQEILPALMALDSLLDHFALAQHPLQKRFKELFESISHFEPSPKPLEESSSQVANMILLLKEKAALAHPPAAKQCLEHAVWNLEMLDYRLVTNRAASLAGVDLLVNECFDHFHTVCELVLRAHMIQKQLYRTEKEAHQELGHSLEAQVKKAGFSFEGDVKEFIKEYDQVSFTRFSGRSETSAAESLAQETRKAASLQRRLLGQKGYDELTQVWEELEQETSYNCQLDGFTVSASRSTKKALQIYQTALEKVHRDVDVLLKFLSLMM